MTPMADPTRETGGRGGGVTWAADGRTRPGSERSGDAWCVLEEAGRTLLAVIDGLGHGDEAHEASSTIAEALRSRWPAPLTELLAECHDAARRTRGGVLSAAEIDVRTTSSAFLSWVGVGNVEGSVWRRRGSGFRRLDWLFLAGGVVGFRLPQVRERRIGLEPGDMLVLSTDGAPGTHDEPPPGPEPRAAARTLLERHAIDRDDALVLVARYLPTSQRP